MTHEQTIIKGLDDAAIARVYHRKRQATHKAATFTQRLALWLVKATALANFGLMCFAWLLFNAIF
jgi:hypothetical protein